MHQRPAVTAVTAPQRSSSPGTEYRFEVVAIGRGGNQTIMESSFTTAP